MEKEKKAFNQKVLVLRQQTNCPLLECRSALEEANGDINLAKRILVRNHPMRFSIMDQPRQT